MGRINIKVPDSIKLAPSDKGIKEVKDKSVNHWFHTVGNRSILIHSDSEDKMVLLNKGSIARYVKESFDIDLSKTKIRSMIDKAIKNESYENLESLCFDIASQCLNIEKKDNPLDANAKQVKGEILQEIDRFKENLSTETKTSKFVSAYLNQLEEVVTDSSESLALSLGQLNVNLKTIFQNLEAVENDKAQFLQSDFTGKTAVLVSKERMWVDVLKFYSSCASQEGLRLANRAFSSLQKNMTPANVDAESLLILDHLIQMIQGAEEGDVKERLMADLKLSLDYLGTYDLNAYQKLCLIEERSELACLYPKKQTQEIFDKLENLVAQVSNIDLNNLSAAKRLLSNYSSLLKNLDDAAYDTFILGQEFKESAKSDLNALFELVTFDQVQNAYTDLMEEAAAALISNLNETLASVQDERSSNFDESASRLVQVLVDIGIQVDSGLLIKLEALGLSSEQTLINDLELQMNVLLELSQDGKIGSIIDQLLIGKVLVEIESAIAGLESEDDLHDELQQLKNTPLAMQDLTECRVLLDKIQLASSKNILSELTQTYVSSYQNIAQNILEKKAELKQFSSSNLPNCDLSTWDELSEIYSQIAAIEEGLSLNLIDSFQVTLLSEAISRLQKNSDLLYAINFVFEGIDVIKEAFEELVLVHADSPLFDALKVSLTSISLADLKDKGVGEAMAFYKDQFAIEERAQDLVGGHQRLENVIQDVIEVINLKEVGSFSGITKLESFLDELQNSFSKYNSQISIVEKRSEVADIQKLDLDQLENFQNMMVSNRNLMSLSEKLMSYMKFVNGALDSSQRQSQIEILASVLENISFISISEEGLNSLDRAMEALLDEHMPQIQSFCDKTIISITADVQSARYQLEGLGVVLHKVENKPRDALLKKLDDFLNNRGASIQSNRDPLDQYKELTNFSQLLKTIQFLDSDVKSLRGQLFSAKVPADLKDKVLGQIDTLTKDLSDLSNWEDAEFIDSLSGSFSSLRDQFMKELPAAQIKQEFDKNIPKMHLVPPLYRKWQGLQSSSVSIVSQIVKDLNANQVDVVDGFALLFTNRSELGSAFDVEVDSIDDQVLSKMKDAQVRMININQFTALVNDLHEINQLIASSGNIDLELLESTRDQIIKHINEDSLPKAALAVQVLKGKVQFQKTTLEALKFEEKKPSLLHDILLGDSRQVTRHINNLKKYVDEGLSFNGTDRFEFEKIMFNIKGSIDSLADNAQSYDIHSDKFSLAIKGLLVNAQRLSLSTNKDPLIEEKYQYLIDRFVEDFISEVTLLDRINVLIDLLKDSGISSGDKTYTTLYALLQEKHAELYVDVVQSIIDGDSVEKISEGFTKTVQEWSAFPDKIANEAYHIFYGLDKLQNLANEEQYKEVRLALATVIKLHSKNDPQLKDDIQNLNVLAHQFTETYSLSDDLIKQFDLLLEDIGWDIDFSKDITRSSNTAPTAVILHQHNERVQNASSGLLQEEMAVEAALRRISTQVNEVNALFIGTEWSLSATSLEETISQMDRLATLSAKYPNVTMAPASIAWSYFLGSDFGENLYLSYNILPVFKAGALVGLYNKFETAGDLDTAQSFQTDVDKNSFCIWGMKPDGVDGTSTGVKVRLDQRKNDHPEFAQFLTSLDNVNDLADFTYLTENGMAFGLEICADHKFRMTSNVIEKFPSSKGLDIQLLTSHGSLPVAEATAVKDGGMHCALDALEKNRTFFNQVGVNVDPSGSESRYPKPAFDKSRDYSNESEVNGGCASHILLEDNEAKSKAFSPSIASSERSLFSQSVLSLDTLLSQVKLSNGQSCSAQNLAMLLQESKDLYYPSNQVPTEGTSRSIRQAFHNMLTRYTFQDESSIDACIQNLEKGDLTTLKENFTDKQILKLIAELTGQSFTVKYDLESIPYELIKSSSSSLVSSNPINIGYSFQERAFYSLDLGDVKSQIAEKMQERELECQSILKGLYNGDSDASDRLIEAKLQLKMISKMGLPKADTNEKGYLNMCIEGSYQYSVHELTLHLEVETRLNQVLDFTSSMGMLNFNSLAYDSSNQRFYGTLNKLSGDVNKHSILDALVADMQFLKESKVLNVESPRLEAIRESIGKIDQMYRAKSGILFGLSDEELANNVKLDTLLDLVGR